MVWSSGRESEAAMGKDDELWSPLSDSPKYLQAIGLVTVEINSMETLLASLFGVTFKVSPEIGRAIYYAPKGATARLDILVEEAAKAAITDNPRLLASIRSAASRAKGIFTDRNAVAHDLWAIPAGTTAVHRGSLEQLRVADFEELGAIVGRARELKSRCLVLLTRLTLGRQDQGDWPATVAEMRKRSKS
jgi:hypothetical protein